MSNPLKKRRRAFEVDSEVIGSSTFSSMASEVNHEQFERHRWVLVYRDLATELDFLHERIAENPFRFIWICIIAIPGSILYSAQQFVVDSGISSGYEMTAGFVIAIVFELLMLGIGMYWKANRHVRIGSTLARELVVFGMCVLFSTEMGRGVPFLMNNGQCTWLYSHNSSANNTNCPWRIVSLWYIVGPVSLMIGRPRFVLACGQILAGFVGSCTVFWYEAIATRTEVTWCVLAAMYSVFCAVLTYFDERQHRRRFELRRRLEVETEQLRAAEAALLHFVLEITPKHLHARLKEPHQLIVDTSEDAVALTIVADDVERLINQSLPARSAVLLGTFASRIMDKAPAFGLTVIRNMGDSMTLVGGLFGDKIELGSLAPQAARFALFVRDFDCGGGQRVPCRSGVAAGPIIGMPLGTTWVRYDAFGPPIFESQSLAAKCPRGCVRLSTSIEELVTQHGGLQIDRDSDGAFGSNFSQSPRAASASASIAPEECKIELQPGSTEASTTALLDSVVRRSSTVIRLPSAPSCDSDVSKSCCTESFTNPTIEAAQVTHRRRYDRTAFVACTVFFTAFVTAMLCAVVEERRNTIDAAAGVGMTLLFLAVVGYAVLWNAVRVAGDLDTPAIPAVDERHYAALVGLNVLMMAGATFTRSSIIGDDIGYLLIASSVASMTAASTRKHLIIGHGSLFAAYYVLMWSFRQKVVPGNLAYVPVAVLVILNSAFHRDSQLRALFRNNLAGREANREVQYHAELREAVLQGLIPRQLQRSVNAESINYHRLDGWLVDDCAAIAVQLHSNFFDGHDTTADMFLRAAEDPAKWRDQAEAAIGVIEEAVRTCPHKTLDIVSVFGGGIVIAGPLTDGVGDLVQAAEDAMHVVHAMVHSGLSLTAALEIEMAVNVLRQSAFPTHQVFGPAVATARGLVAAAPAPMVVITEKVAALNARECAPCEGVNIAPAESWGVRGRGIVRVCRVTPCDIAE